MGKSGHVGRKIAATLASTGTPAYFVHPGEASHGDLGMIQAGDAILALSWSGETAELADIITYSRRYGVALIAWDRQPPIPVVGAEAIAVIGGFIAASIALGIAGSIAGHPGFARGALTGDFIMTALLYPIVRFVILPASIRVARR
jgi:hypothetical protein